MALTLQPILSIPMVQPGDDLARMVFAALKAAGVSLEDGDILVLAQKIISKSEDRLINLNDVVPSDRALELAAQAEKDPRFIELVLRESCEVLRVRPGTIITQHRRGFICANAGIDHSNVRGPYGNPDDWVLLLPVDSDASARRLQEGLQELSGMRLGIVIIDSHGRAWRNGTVGVAIGLANVPGIVDMRGHEDLYGYKLRVTTIAAADELAAAASLMMGQADERTPVVHVRGFPYPLRESTLQEMIREKEMDLFR